jgi:DNA-binding NarL/FixJ family response regulator
MDGTVLLLDYSSYERQKIRHILEKAGRFEVIEAGDIRQFRLLDLDIMDLKLIIMDLAFPSESDGLDVLRKNKGICGRQHSCHYHNAGRQAGTESRSGEAFRQGLYKKALSGKEA